MKRKNNKYQNKSVDIDGLVNAKVDEEIKKLASYYRKASHGDKQRKTLPEPSDIAWSEKKIVNALTAMSRGDVTQASLLIQAMTMDAAYMTILKKRISNLTSRNINIVANTPLQQRYVKQLTPTIPVIQDTIRNMMFWWLQLGTMVALIDWEYKDLVMQPTIRVLHPYYLQWDIENECWYYQLRNQRLKVTPGDGRWLLFGDNIEDLRTSAVRALGKTFGNKLIAKYYYTYWLQNRALNWIHVDYLASETQDDVGALVDGLINNVGPMTLVATPRPSTGENYKVTPLNMSGDGWAAYDNVDKQAFKEYTLFFLGANLGTDISDNGSRAASEVHETMEDKKAADDNQYITKHLKEQLILPYAQINIDRSITLKHLPDITWDFEVPEEINKSLDSTLKYLSVIEKMRFLGYEPDEEFIVKGNKMGLKKSEEEQV